MSIYFSVLIGLVGTLVVAASLAGIRKLVDWRQRNTVLDAREEFPGRMTLEMAEKYARQCGQAVENYHRRKWIAALFSVAFLIFGALQIIALQFIMLSDSSQKIAPYAGICLGLWVVALFFIFPELPRCPRCQRGLDGKLGPYCPSCGHRAVDGNPWQARCDACGQKFDLEFGLGRPKQRKYRIRTCTHCGLSVTNVGF